MKKSEEDLLKCAINESTLSTAARSPFPNGEGCDTRIPLFSIQRLSQGGRQRGGGFAAKNEANPASLRSAAPSKGRGSRGRSLLPMEGGAPKGRRLEGESGMKESEEMHLKYVVYESTLSTAGAVPLPQWGRQRGGGFAAKNEANPASLRSAAPSKGRGSRGHSLLPMEGGAPKGRRLDGGSGMKESEEMHLKSTINESTLSTADAVPLPQWGRLRYEDTAFLDTTPFQRGKAKRRRLRRQK